MVKFNLNVIFNVAVKIINKIKLAFQKILENTPITLIVLPILLIFNFCVFENNFWWNFGFNCNLINFEIDEFVYENSFDIPCRLIIFKTFLNKIQFSSPRCKTTAAATTNLMWMNLRYTLCMYLYDGSFDIQMLNYCHPNCLSHFKPVKFDLCVQIVQIQIATAYFLFSFFRNFFLLYCNLFELDNLWVPGTIWKEKKISIDCL